MVVNAIAPWEGQLVWVGTPNGGFTQTNEEWKSVDFVLKYIDGKLQERHICLNAFGVDKVNRLLSTPLGTTLRVTFHPTAREYNEKWYGKNEAFGITTVQQQAPAPAPQPAPQFYPQQQAPAYTPPGTAMPPQAPVYQQQAQIFPQPAQPLKANNDFEDIPF